MLSGIRHAAFVLSTRVSRPLEHTTASVPYSALRTTLDQLQAWPPCSVTL